MRARRHRQRALLLAAVGLLAAGIGIVSWATPLARRVELSSVDARFDVRGKQKPPADVVMVGLDAKSLAQLNAPAPIPRHYHAEVIDRLRQAGAKVIAYDFQFTNQTKPDDDGALLDSLARTPGVILGTTLIGPGGGVLGSAKTRAATHVIPASTAYPPRAQRGGVFRRVVYSNGLQSFSVAAAERALGHPVDRSKFKGDGAQRRDVLVLLRQQRVLLELGRDRDRQDQPSVLNLADRWAAYFWSLSARRFGPPRHYRPVP